MIITKTNFFTKLSLAVLTILSLAASDTNCGNGSKVALLGLTALGAYLGITRAKASFDAKLDLDGARIKTSPTPVLDLRQEWELNRQKQQEEQARALRKQELEGLINRREAGLLDIVRFRLALY